MHIEYIIYGYGLICVSMLVFNVVYSLYLQNSQRRLTHKSLAMDRETERQLARIREGEAITPSHRNTVLHYLSRIGDLMAFEAMMGDRDRQEPTLQRYMEALTPTFLQLTVIYREREDMQAAYYCHFLTRHLYCSSPAMLADFRREVLAYLDKPGLYCRVHALRAICAFGDVQGVIDALILLKERPGASLHTKVLVEVLLTFQGDGTQLIEALWQHFDRFSLPMQRALLDFMRFYGGQCQDEMLNILQDAERNQELRFAAMRYFGKFPAAAAQAPLLAFLQDTAPGHWEYAAIAASVLAAYEGERVDEALAQAMHNSNWYVRYNAAASLEKHGLSEAQLLAVAGDDAQAREMLRYRLHMRQQGGLQEGAGL